MMSVDVASVLARTLSFILSFQGAGAAIFVTLLSSSLDRSHDSLRALATWASGLGALCVLAHYFLEAGRMAGNWSGVFDPALQMISFTSNLSTATIVRILGLVLVITGSRICGRTSNVIVTSGVLAIAISFTFVGHTTEEGIASWSKLVLVVHVLVAIFWFGSLLPLLTAARKEGPLGASATIASFSRIATVAVPFIFFAGLTLMLLIIPGWSVFGRPYGKLLAFKISGFAVLVILASLNKWRYGPFIAKGGTTAKRFQQSVMTEFLIMSAVLAATALMTAFYSPFSD